MNNQDEVLAVSPEQTYHAIRSSIVTAQHILTTAVNSAMVTAYWEIGEQIYKACGEHDRAEYGTKLAGVSLRPFNGGVREGLHSA
ncbi:MAG: DUF1016 N-terminal domain-containing protein [Flavonifractor plautii]